MEHNADGEGQMRENRWTIVYGVAATMIVGSSVTAAQVNRRPLPPERQGAAIQVSLNAGGQRYESSAPGQCTHAPTASIYGVASELWTVQQSDNGKSLNLSLWQPKDGTRPMVSLTVASGKSYRVSTVKGSQIVGSAKVSMEPSGKGGTFTVYAKSADGADIMGTIKCDAFAPHIAEGGL
jgi:hypothetical protein